MCRNNTQTWRTDTQTAGHRMTAQDVTVHSTEWQIPLSCSPFICTCQLVKQPSNSAVYQSSISQRQSWQHTCIADAIWASDSASLSFSSFITFSTMTNSMKFNAVTICWRQSCPVIKKYTLLHKKMHFNVVHSSIWQHFLLHTEAILFMLFLTKLITCRGKSITHTAKPTTHTGKLR